MLKHHSKRIPTARARNHPRRRSPYGYGDLNVLNADWNSQKEKEMKCHMESVPVAFPFFRGELRCRPICRCFAIVSAPAAAASILLLLLHSASAFLLLLLRRDMELPTVYKCESFTSFVPFSFPFNFLAAMF
jgi:hypothetical protein